ncbi:uncharacterized protein DS421_15g511320 [Arachis hypogaea]|nr:uncharacterized protein DS421_15g511320 [Arachis hypogaea]
MAEWQVEVAFAPRFLVPKPGGDILNFSSRPVRLDQFAPVLIGFDRFDPVLTGSHRFSSLNGLRSKPNRTRIRFTDFPVDRSIRFDFYNYDGKAYQGQEERAGMRIKC